MHFSNGNDNPEDEDSFINNFKECREIRDALYILESLDSSSSSLHNTNDTCGILYKKTERLRIDLNRSFLKNRTLEVTLYKYKVGTKGEDACLDQTVIQNSTLIDCIIGPKLTYKGLQIINSNILGVKWNEKTNKTSDEKDIESDHPNTTDIDIDSITVSSNFNKTEPGIPKYIYDDEQKSILDNSYKKDYTCGDASYMQNHCDYTSTNTNNAECSSNQLELQNCRMQNCFFSDLSIDYIIESSIHNTEFYNLNKTAFSISESKIICSNPPKGVLECNSIEGSQWNNDEFTKIILFGNIDSTIIRYCTFNRVYFGHPDWKRIKNQVLTLKNTTVFKCTFINCNFGLLKMESTTFYECSFSNCIWGSDNFTDKDKIMKSGRVEGYTRFYNCFLSEPFKTEELIDLIERFIDDPKYIPPKAGSN